jgi:hypothetical protein
MGLVPQSSVRSDIDQPFDVHGQFASQVALDLLVLLDDVSNFDNVFIGKVFDSGVGIHARLTKNLDRQGPAYAKYACQSNLDTLVLGKINPGYSRHKKLLYPYDIKYLNSTAF